MQLTKGAIGNLINRYKAVLKKCHLLNVFGSLAVAGMLVMGGAAAAGAADVSSWDGKQDLTITEGEHTFATMLPSAPNDHQDMTGKIILRSGSLTINGAIFTNGVSEAQTGIEMTGGVLNIIRDTEQYNGYGAANVQIQFVDVKNGTINIGPRENDVRWDSGPMLLAYEKSTFSGDNTVVNINGGTLFNGSGDSSGEYITEMRFEEGVTVNLNGETLNNASVIKASPSTEGS